MIRLARTTDWGAISAISKTAGYLDYINMIGPSYLLDGEVFVFEDDEIRGFIKVEFSQDNSAWLSGIRVEPDHWRRGIGRALSAAAMDRARQKGCKVARLLIHEDNNKSLGLAIKSGFKEIARFQIYEGMPDLEGFEMTTKKPSGILNTGWKFIRADEADAITSKVFSRDGWEIIQSDEDTFQILAVGKDKLVLRKEGFTCIDKNLKSPPSLDLNQTGEIIDWIVMEKELLASGLP